MEELSPQKIQHKLSDIEVESDDLYEAYDQWQRQLQSENSDPNQKKNDENLIQIHDRLGALALAIHKFDEADEHLQAALSIKIDKYGSDTIEVADACLYLAKLSEKIEQYEKAIQYHERTILICGKVGGEQSLHMKVESLERIGVLHEKLANFHESERRIKDAHRQKLDIQPSYPLGTSYIAMGIIEETLGNWQAAAENYTHGVQAIREYYNEKHPLYAEALDREGSMYFRRFQYKEAEERHRQAYAIRLGIFREPHLDLAQSLHCLSLISIRQRRYDDALKEIDRCLEMKSQILGDDSLAYSDSLLTKSSILFYLDREKDAEKILNKVIETYEKRYGQNHPCVAIAHEEMGMNCKYRSNKEEARKHLDQGHEIKKKFFPEDHVSVSTSYNRIGLLYKDAKDYDNCIKYMKKAIQIRISRGYHPLEANCQYNIAQAYEEQEKFTEAIDYYEQARQGYQKYLGENCIDVSDCYKSMSRMNRKLANYDKAELYILKSLTIRRKVLGDFHRNISDCLGTLGHIYEDKKEFNKAVEQYLMAIAILKQIKGDDSEDTADRYFDLAGAYLETEEYDKAEESYNIYQRIYEKIEGKKYSNNVALAIINKGVVAYRRGNYDKSLLQFSEARELYEKINGRYSENVGLMYMKMGIIQKIQQKYDDALQQFKIAAEILENLPDQKTPKLALIYSEIGSVYNQISKPGMCYLYDQKVVKYIYKNFWETQSKSFDFKYSLERGSDFNNEEGNIVEAKKYVTVLKRKVEKNSLDELRANQKVKIRYQKADMNECAQNLWDLL